MAVLENDVLVGPVTPAAGVTTISLDFDGTGWEAAWLEVYKTGSETPLVLGTDYTVSGAGTVSAVVTLTNPANGTDAYSVFLVTPLERSSDMQLRGEFKSEPFNVEMDRIWQRLQLHWTHITRSLRLSATSAMNTIISAVSPGQLVQMKADGTGFVGYDPNITVSQVDAWYHTRGSAQAAAAAALDNGSIVSLAGLLYEVDSTATGTASATNDLGVDGLVPFGEINFAHYGCNAASDCTTAYRSAIENAAGSPIRHDGTIRVDGAVSHDGAVNIFSPGDTAKLDLSNGGSVSFIAGLTALPDLNAAIRQYDNQVSFASAHGLSVGDVFCVWNPTDYSFNPQRDSYRDGDWIEVAEVPNVNDVVMFGTSPDQYAASDMECYKMEGEGVSITGVTVIPNPSGVHFFIQNHKRVDCRMGFERGADYAGVQILRCYNIKFECLPMDVNQGDAYPLSIGNSKNFTVDLDRSRSTRHVAGFGGSGGPGSVPNRNGKIIGGRLTNNISLGVGAADFHGNNDNLQYIGCDIYGANMGGRNSALIDCTLYGAHPFSDDDNVIYSSANGGGLTRIHNCTLKVRGDANPFAFIHFDLLNLASDACFDIRNLVVDHADTSVTPIQVLEFNLGTPVTISGATQANPCVVSATGHGFVSGQRVKIKNVVGMTELNGNTYTVTVIDANSFSLDVDATGFTAYTSGGTAAHPYRIDLILDGLNYRGAAPARLFEISGTQDFADQMSLQVDNIKLPRCTLVRCSNTDNYDMPMRLPKTTVSADLSVTTAANYFSTSQLDYQWIYPKVPNGLVSIHTTDQAYFTQSPFPTANKRRVRLGDCHLAISSFDGANFTFAKDFRIVGEFWINDL